jgi:hypothetical protein
LGRLWIEKVFASKRSGSGNPFRLLSKNDSATRSGFNAAADVTLTNDTTKDYLGWSVSFDFAAEITNFWNAKKLSETQTDGVWRYTFSAPDNYNRFLGAGQSLGFGFNAAPNNSATAPQNVFITSSGDSFGDAPPSRSPGGGGLIPDYTLSYRPTSAWGNGANLEVTLQNNGTERLTDWVVGFELSRLITNSWNADPLTSVYGAQYEYGSFSYNRVIAPGGSISFGITVGPGSSGIEDLRLLAANGSVVPEPMFYSLLAGVSALALVITRRPRR